MSGTVKISDVMAKQDARIAELEAVCAAYRTDDEENLARIAELEAEIARVKQEAKGHAIAARTAQTSLYECYKAVTGASGEPGDWHGAEPVRKHIAELEAEVARIKELASAQAEDAGLWFAAETAPEAYLQQELRKLHAAIEGEQETKRAETTLRLENGSTIKFRGTP